MRPGSRRAFLEGLTAALASGAWPSSGGAEGRLLGMVPFVGEPPFPLETTVGAGLGQRRALDLARVPDDEGVVSAERFFVRTGVPDRLPPGAAWAVALRGLAGADQKITAAELGREAREQGVHLLECAGNSRGLHFGLMSVAGWRGVPLVEVLDRIRPRAGASQLLVSGFDEHSALDAGSVPGASWIFDLSAIRRSGAFLATAMNGAPLRPEHGAPIRLVVPGWYACAAIKWVNEIAFLDDAAAATDHMREYAGRTHQDPSGPRDRERMAAGQRPDGPPRSRDFRPATIDAAAVPVRVERWAGPRGVFHRVRGVRWGAASPAARLQIRLGAGEWSPVTEHQAVGAWSLWSYEFEQPRQGPCPIRLRLAGGEARARRLEAGYYDREVDLGLTGRVGAAAG